MSQMCSLFVGLENTDRSSYLMSFSMPTRRGTKGMLTRARIVREATELFSLKGFFHTTLDDVMNRTGLTKGGFYAHFDSKEALVHAAIEHATERWVTKVFGGVMEAPTPRAQLHALFDAYRAYAVDRTFEGGCFFVNLAIELDDQDDALRRIVDARFDQLRQVVAGIVERGKIDRSYRREAPASAIATLVVAALTGTMMLSKSAASFDAFEETIAMLRQLVASYEEPAA